MKRKRSRRKSRARGTVPYATSKRVSSAIEPYRLYIHHDEHLEDLFGRHRHDPAWDAGSGAATAAMACRATHWRPSSRFGWQHSRQRRRHTSERGAGYGETGVVSMEKHGLDRETAPGRWSASDLTEYLLRRCSRPSPNRQSQICSSRTPSAGDPSHRCPRRRRTRRSHSSIELEEQAAY
jgi:hypothetical protein